MVRVVIDSEFFGVHCYIVEQWEANRIVSNLSKVLYQVTRDEDDARIRIIVETVF